jgi:hypothetical protein
MTRMPTPWLRARAARRRHDLVLAAATAAAVLAPTAGLAVSASSELVCSLVGEDAHNGTNPTSGHQPNLKLYGTDLGISFRQGRTVFMLFGDTWIEDDFICQPPPLSDDSLGWISLPLDDDPDDCLDIRFPAEIVSGEVKPLRVFDGLTELNMGALRTPITGWSDNRRPYGYFTGEATVLCQPHREEVCPDGLQCQDDVFCVDPGSSAWPTVGARAGTRLIAASRLGLAPQHFSLGYTFATNKFLNATSRVIGRLNKRRPEENIYEPTASPRELLMWGRPNFYAWPPDTTSDVYLLHHRLSTLDGPGTSINWQPRYFAGLDAIGNPVWTSDQIFATAVIAAEELESVLQFSVAWVAPIKRFVMLYSGRLPGVLPDNQTGIYLRIAKHPWGPWSKPQLVWNAIDDGAYDCDGIMYDPTDPVGSCTESDPYRPGAFNQCPAQTPVPNFDFGVEYGVNILDTFTKPGIQLNSAVIYWNLSTWNPYRVVLMKTRLDNAIVGAP